MKTHNVNVRLTDGDREYLERKAQAEGLTISGFIRNNLKLKDPLEQVLKSLPINDRQRKYCRLWITDYDEMTADEIETTVNRTLEKYNSDADFFKGENNMDYRLKKNNPLLSEDDEDAAREEKASDALANADENTDMTKTENNPLLEENLEDD